MERKNNGGGLYMSDLQQEQYNLGNNELLGTVQHNLSDIMPSASEIGQLCHRYLGVYYL